jgi:adenosylcobinamide-GDP ribazoletransferase
MSAVPSLRLAVGTLTVWPAGRVDDLNATVARNAMVLGPLAVLPLALLATVTAWASNWLGAPDLVTGMVTVAVLALGTRALHLDGLADTADGLGSGWDRDKALQVMRRGDVGPMGVVVLILVLVLQAAAFGALVDGVWGAVQLAVLLSCSRAALVLVCLRGVPAARPDGLGAAVAGSVPRVAAVAVWLGVAAVLTAASVVAGDSWVTGPVATLLALAAVGLLLRRCIRRLGGVTGDVMGACIEVACTALAVGTVVQWS